jgi:hypothetical protein
MLFAASTHRVVSLLMSFVLAPLSVLGLGAPLCLWMDEPWPARVGGVFLVWAALLAAGNVYMVARRAATGLGAGAYPATLSLTLIPACLLLGPRAVAEHGQGWTLMWCVFVVPTVIALDFLGQTMLGQWLWRLWREHGASTGTSDHDQL